MAGYFCICVESNVISEVTERCTRKTNEKPGRPERSSPRPALKKSRKPCTSVSKKRTVTRLGHFETELAFLFFSFNIIFFVSADVSRTVYEMAIRDARSGTLRSASESHSPCFLFRSECLRDLSNKRRRFVPAIAPVLT